MMVGIIGSSISQVMWLCASFRLLAAAARKVSSAVPISSIGSSTNSIWPIASSDMSRVRAMPVANCALSLIASSDSSRVHSPSRHAAAILPLTMAPREAGVASSGSSDCRSRSPAVASSTSAAPPRKAVMIRKYGSITDSISPRWASGVATSRVPTLTGCATEASMPRASRRNAPTWPE